MIQIFDKHGKLKSSGIPGFGTVTNVSSGSLSPLFNTVVNNQSTTPIFSFSKISQSQKLFYASPNNSSGDPIFRSIQISDLPSLTSLYTPVTRTLTINGVTQDLTTNRNWDIPTLTSWGGITGTLSAQTDLQDALDDKQNLIGYTPEDVANKSTSIVTDQLSDVKYPSVKSVYDWAISVFTTTSAVATQISTALVGYATESFVTSQGYITNVITALGFTPENVANKSTSTSLGTSDTLYPTQNAVKTYVDGKVKRTCVFNNRSTWTFPANVSPNPFILVGSTNYELAVANINSGTDVALTALGTLTLQPISVAPFDCIIKSFLIESRVVGGSFFNFPLRVVIGSNLVPQNPTANVVVTNVQVCEDFQVSTVNGTIYNYTNTTGGVTIPKGHGIIPLIAFQRPNFLGGSLGLLTIQIEIQEI